MGEMANPQCDLLRQSYRLPMAQPADQLSAVADCSLLLLELEEDGLVGTDQRNTGEEDAEEGWKKRAAQCGGDRQPKCEDFGRR